jgi:hypothetical protein
MCIWFKTDMVLHDYRLPLFYTTIENGVKMCHFYFGGQGAKFQNVFEDGSIKVAHCKKILCFEMHHNQLN